MASDYAPQPDAPDPLDIQRRIKGQYSTAFSEPQFSQPLAAYKWEDTLPSPVSGRSYLPATGRGSDLPGSGVAPEPAPTTTRGQPAGLGR
jgi:hypothetical protein